MIRFEEKHLLAYAANDTILELLHAEEQPGDSEFSSHRWLLESLPKRMIYRHMYGDLLAPSAQRFRILDVGGGFTALSRLLAKLHDYSVLDIMANDDGKLCNIAGDTLCQSWIEADWLSFQPVCPYDLVISNDLFPNVDQRLSKFLERYIPFCREIRLLLTYHNDPRWYKVERCDGDEVFHMLAWDGLQLARVLEPYVGRIKNAQLNLLGEKHPSQFRNGRQTCLVTITGDRKT